MRRVTAVLAVGWLAVGLAGAYRYLRRYDEYRGFEPPATPAGIARGSVRQVSFFSPAAGGENRYLVYLPPGYDGRRRYPVLYLLHGVPGKADVFTTVDPVQVFANVLIAHRRMRPMIIVMPVGRQGTLAGDTEWANTGSGRWMDFVLDVEHDVDRRFATLADRRHRGIAGDSEGAYGAINVALHHLGDFSVAESWGGYVDSTPDAVPVISSIEGIRGFFLAAGCSGHGFGIGPGIGQLAADLVANDTPCVDPTPFRLSRLLDGSKVEVGSI